MNYLNLSIREHEYAWHNAKTWHPSNPDFLLESNLLNLDSFHFWAERPLKQKTFKQLFS